MLGALLALGGAAGVFGRAAGDGDLARAFVSSDAGLPFGAGESARVFGAGGAALGLDVTLGVGDGGRTTAGVGFVAVDLATVDLVVAANAGSAAASAGLVAGAGLAAGGAGLVVDRESLGLAFTVAFIEERGEDDVIGALTRGLDSPRIAGFADPWAGSNSHAETLANKP